MTLAYQMYCAYNTIPKLTHKIANSRPADPNIPETGEQLAKSNHGPDDCCYRYCSSYATDGVCAVCQTSTLPDAGDAESDRLRSQSVWAPSSTSSASTPSRHPSANDRDAADWWHTATADDVQAYADHCPATVQAATGPRCQTPFQQSIAAKSSASARHPHRTGRPPTAADGWLRWLRLLTVWTAPPRTKPSTATTTTIVMAAGWWAAAVAVAAVGCTALERLLVGVLRSLGAADGGSSSDGSGVAVDLGASSASCRCVAALALAVMWCHVSS